AEFIESGSDGTGYPESRYGLYFGLPPLVAGITAGLGISSIYGPVWSSPPAIIRPLVIIVALTIGSGSSSLVSAPGLVLIFQYGGVTLVVIDPAADIIAVVSA